MTYNPSKPAPNDLLSDSQLDIQTNFSVANTSFGKNHFPFDDASIKNGKHKFVEMPNSAVIPAGLAALEGTIYTKQSNSVSEIFYTPDNSTNEYQMTRTESSSIASFGTTIGWTFLPGGLLLQYGIILVPASTDQDVTFSVPFTTFVSSITTTGINCVSFIKSNTLLKFVVRQDQNFARNVFWMAIGK